jgi:hypothetical protein
VGKDIKRMGRNNIGELRNNSRGRWGAYPRYQGRNKYGMKKKKK